MSGTGRGVSRGRRWTRHGNGGEAPTVLAGAQACVRQSPWRCSQRVLAGVRLRGCTMCGLGSSCATRGGVGECAVCWAGERGEGRAFVGIDRERGRVVPGGDDNVRVWVGRRGSRLLCRRICVAGPGCVRRGRGWDEGGGCVCRIGGRISAGG
ncbi:hypothetical protein BC628DRAFT_1398416 [Trametes gibbosa]|nr:hypothetical protein BC628DRAFT_1398416 [Trametes gibbosa]